MKYLNALKIKIFAITGIVSMLSFAIAAVPAHAAISTGNLGDLLVLNQLFGGTGTMAGTGVTGNNLGNLFVLDRLFNGNSSGILSGATGTGDLGNLFLLNQLFGGGSVVNGTTVTTNGTTNNLGNLIILDRLFNSNSRIF